MKIVKIVELNMKVSTEAEDFVQLSAVEDLALKQKEKKLQVVKQDDSNPSPQDEDLISINNSINMEINYNSPEKITEDLDLTNVPQEELSK